MVEPRMRRSHKNAKKALNRYKKQNTFENRIDYKRLKASAKQTIKQS